MGDDWKRMHDNAWSYPVAGFERGIRDMVLGWEAYATQHGHRYESLIGDDGVLGPEWAAIGGALIGLLNGNCGRFDCGTLDARIRNFAATHGVKLGD